LVEDRIYPEDKVGCIKAGLHQSRATWNPVVSARSYKVARLIIIIIMKANMTGLNHRCCHGGVTACLHEAEHNITFTMVYCQQGNNSLVLRTVLHLSIYISKQTPLDVGVEIILSTRVNLSESHEDSANSGEATKDSKHFTLFIPYLFPVAGEGKRTMNN